MVKERIAIIIVTFNSEKYIGSCVKSILSYFPSELIGEIILIDNCSVDRTTSILDRISAKSRMVKVIKNYSNLGFAKAVNQGIRNNSKADYYLLLNPDTVVKKNAINNLIQCLKNNKAGIAGGSTFGIDRIENGSYFRFPNLQVGLFDFTNLRKLSKSDYWHKYFYYLDSNLKKDNCIPVDVVTGGYMLIRRSTIIRIGYFDERFFMYLEDVDFCYRAKQAGISIYHSNIAKIIHYSGKSSRNKEGVRHSSWLWSRKIYFLKHFDIFTNFVIQPIFLLDDIYILSKLYLFR